MRAKNIPQGLKPASRWQRCTTRLNSCPYAPQGLKPRLFSFGLCGTTKVVPCYKAYEWVGVSRRQEWMA
jgi:hypothetical protein